MRFAIVILIAALVLALVIDGVEKGKKHKPPKPPKPPKPLKLTAETLRMVQKLPASRSQTTHTPSGLTPTAWLNQQVEYLPVDVLETNAQMLKWPKKGKSATPNTKQRHHRQSTTRQRPPAAAEFGGGQNYASGEPSQAETSSASPPIDTEPCNWTCPECTTDANGTVQEYLDWHFDSKLGVRQGGKAGISGCPLRANAWSADQSEYLFTLHLTVQENGNLAVYRKIDFPPIPNTQRGQQQHVPIPYKCQVAYFDTSGAFLGHKIWMLEEKSSDTDGEEERGANFIVGGAASCLCVDGATFTLYPLYSYADRRLSYVAQDRRLVKNTPYGQMLANIKRELLNPPDGGPMRSLDEVVAWDESDDPFKERLPIELKSDIFLLSKKRTVLMARRLFDHHGPLLAGLDEATVANSSLLDTTESGGPTYRDKFKGRVWQSFNRGRAHNSEAGFISVAFNNASDKLSVALDGAIATMFEGFYARPENIVKRLKMVGGDKNRRFMQFSPIILVFQGKPEDKALQLLPFYKVVLDGVGDDSDTFLKGKQLKDGEKSSRLVLYLATKFQKPSR